MTTLSRIIIISIISFLLLSCNFSMNLGPGVDGNGNVVTEERTISPDFNEIKVSQGLDLYISQSDAVGLSVEADENLQDLIMTDVENSILRIYTTENIRRAQSKKIILSIETISAIKATSGSDVYSSNTISLSNLDLHATSGADITIDVITETLECKSTSGSDINVTGTTTNFMAEATSGSDIDASNLKAEISNVKATSGADISVHTSKELTANATSGGDVKYSGNPKKVNKSDNSAGSVKQH
ncbi:head GIN domain-containing protein [Winogradskyella sediminis]|uniref:Auto-transporter adhesin, head GIN domain n=1 Tax=Winogradskyella sediminis TaxID=1382466 RepID=A0A1H1VS71_9FLAO|nr:head GIN domain-containing protein [Winogradskyella sediminis]SDS87613.1 Putative auto-transporter adhesin, head GIN domain [Winogradskyella sediminis]